MRTVLAALDASAAARPVLAAARGLADLTGSTVEAVHVPEGRTTTPESLAARAGVSLRLLEGPVEAALLAALARPEVIAVVVGARATPGGRRPTGRTALRIIEGSSKPVAVVPPEAVAMASRPFRRLLVPLEGTLVSSRPIEEWLDSVIVAEADLVVLHSFTDRTRPRILDHPARDLEILGREFLSRYCPNASDIEMRTGPVGSEVSALTEHEGADLVVLSWSQDASEGHAAVVREVLSGATVPVLLLPVETEQAIDLTATEDGASASSPAVQYRPHSRR